jgi:hypothetical protein
MSNTPSKLTKGALMICGVLFASYIVAYLLVVQRIASPCGGAEHPIPGANCNDVKIVASFRGHLGYVLFSPINSIDRSYIRRRYWSDYTIIDSGSSVRTNYAIEHR